MDWYLNRDDTEAIAELRHQVGEYLRRHAEDPDAAWNGELVFSELVANAVEHGDGAVWISLTWAGRRPHLSVHDLGTDFVLDPSLPDDPYATGGRGLVLASSLTRELSTAAKRAGGKTVTAQLDVTRHLEQNISRPAHPHSALPDLSEADPHGGFGKESFLRALVVQLAQAVEAEYGPDASQVAVAQVGTDVGGRMEQEYRQARKVVGALSPEQLTECYVRLKQAIDGDFYPIEATDERIVLGNRRCPFGDAVMRAPALCRMTSSVFGGIAARRNGEATVVLEERIAVGDPGCRVVVYLGAAPPEANEVGHRYYAEEPEGSTRG